MKNLNLFLLLLIPFLTFGQSRTTDSLALVQLYNDLNGPNWTDGENWLSESPLDDWEGITMSNDRVWKVKLNQFDVEGDFPLSVIELTELNTLEIKGGTINGNLPGDLVALEKLNRLIINECGLSGAMPDNFNQFPALSTCILINNNISGQLPLNLPSTMTYVNWDHNQFTGEIPSAWENANLTWISIKNNFLEGSIDVLATMPSLGTIDMSNNNWDEGPFPDWVDDLENLSWFACENCSLVGDLPSTLDFSERLSHDRVLINNNQLSGDISLLFTGAQSQSGVYLRARNNNFSGEFPAHKVLTAGQIDVRGNKYSSVTEFGDISFNRFDISQNNFTYTTLNPVQFYIQLDSIIGVLYDPQNDLLDSDTLTINESTVLTIDAGDSHANTVYEWIKNNQTIEGETSGQLTLTVDDSQDAGTYYCKMTNSDYPELDLRRSNVKINWEPSTAVDDFERVDIHIYPNPTTDYIQVELTENIKETTFQIISNEGRIVSRGTIDNSQNISILHLNAGVYHLKLQIGSQTVSRKIMKL